MTARALVLLLSCQLSTALHAPARRLRTPHVLRAVSDDATVLFLHGDGVSMLTRRELVPDAPGGNFEKFSVFFDLPVSTYAFQLRLKGAMDTLKSHGLP